MLGPKGSDPGERRGRGLVATRARRALQVLLQRVTAPDEQLGLAHAGGGAKRPPVQAQPAGGVHLVHHRDLVADLDAELGRLAVALGVDLDPDVRPDIVAALSFEAMRARTATYVPDRLGVLRDHDRFFRSGRPGDGRRTLGPDVEARCVEVVEATAPPEVAAWLLR